MTCVGRRTMLTYHNNYNDYTVIDHSDTDSTKYSNNNNSIVSLRHVIAYHSILCHVAMFCIAL